MSDGFDVDLGGPAVHLGCHDHACLIYESREEQFEVLVPFVRLGLESNQRCLYIADDNTPEEVLAALRHGGIDVDAAQRSGALNVVTKHESYLEGGRFDPRRMLALLTDAAARASADGYAALRVTGEMTWAIDDPSFDRLLQYDAQVNRVFASHVCLGLCQYSRRRFSPAVIRDVIRTHPLVITRKTLCHNPHYLPPDALIGAQAVEREVETLLAQLVEREEAQRAMSERDRRYAEAERVGHIGAWELDPRRNVMKFSGGIARILGVPEQQQACEGGGTYEAFLAAIHPDDRTRVDRAYQASVAARTPCELTHRLVLPDGSVRHLRQRWETWYDSRGTPIRSVGVMQDITHLALAQEALALRTRALEACANSVMITDHAGAILWVNPAFELLTGYSAEEVLGRNPRLLKSGRHDEAFYRELWRTIGERRSWQGVLWNRRKDGTVYPDEMTITPIFDASERITHYIAVKSDITARVQAEAAVRESEQRYRRLAENLPDMIWRTDVQGKVLFVNHAVRTFLGYEPDEVLQRPMDAYLSAASIEKLKGWFQAALRGHQSQFFGEAEYLHPRGHLVSGEVHAVLVRDDDSGRVVGIEGVTRDITERKRAEHEHETLRAKLAQTDRLASMGLLAAGVAHEINNPLTFVLYHLETLEQELGRGARLDAAERLRDVVTGARRIKEIVRGLATFSRVESVEREPVDVCRSLDHALVMANNEIRFRARVVKDYAAVPAVLASAGKLAQVFLNLLINAAHAIDEGHVEQNEIRVRTWVDGDHVCIEVSDTGKGIPPENQARLFDPFFTTKAVGVGSGLGLSICQSIVADFGGTIDFASQVGRGSRFVVRLPRMSAQQQPAGETPAAPSGVRGRVLIVDDEAGIRGVIVRILGGQHEVVTASSGAEARVLLERDPRFDLILCDLMMPAMSGMDLHSWLADHDPALARRMVFMTGGAFTAGASEYLARVGNLRVEKPFDARQLADLAAECVSASRAVDPDAR